LGGATRICEPSIAPIMSGIPDRASNARAFRANAASDLGILIMSGVSRFTTEAVNNRTHRRVLVSERPLRIMIDVDRYVVPCPRKRSAVDMIRLIGIGGRPRPSCRRSKSSSVCLRMNFQSATVTRKMDWNFASYAQSVEAVHVLRATGSNRNSKSLKTPGPSWHALMAARLRT